MKKNKKKKKNVTIQKTFEIAVLLPTQDQNFTAKLLIILTYINTKRKWFKILETV